MPTQKPSLLRAGPDSELLKPRYLSGPLGGYRGLALFLTVAEALCARLSLLRNERVFLN